MVSWESQIESFQVTKAQTTLELALVKFVFGNLVHLTLVLIMAPPIANGRRLDVNGKVTQKLENTHGIFSDRLGNSLYEHFPSKPLEIFPEPSIDPLANTIFNWQKGLSLGLTHIYREA